MFSEPLISSINYNFEEIARRQCSVNSGRKKRAKLLIEEYFETISINSEIQLMLSSYLVSNQNRSGENW